jgi:ferrochelatase
MDNNKSHKYFLGVKNFSHEYKPAVGVLVVNLGTPDAPTAKAVRVYLREFLNDPRIIEIPRILWMILLNCIILVTRPPRVAKLYKSVWTEEGSPLLVTTRKTAIKLAKKLAEKFASPHFVEVGMRYGNPSMKVALQKLKDKNCSRIIVLPLFGQYSSTTVGSAMDAIFDELKTWRWVPELRSINQFHDYSPYINAVANNIKNHWEKNGKASKLLLSFHGMPKRYVLAGDPYHCHCHKTARLICEKLGLEKDQYVVAFQSQFGNEEWIKPATDKTLQDLAKNGLDSVDVVCPGFIADCLETIEEIEEENKEVFLSNGGKKYHYIPSVNDGDEFIDVLVKLIDENSKGWLTEKDQWDQQEYEDEAKRINERFHKLNAK